LTGLFNAFSFVLLKEKSRNNKSEIPFVKGDQGRVKKIFFATQPLHKTLRVAKSRLCFAVFYTFIG
jgi:hypothetical protein